MRKNSKVYSLGEEIFSAVVHGIGSLLGIVALVLLIVFCAKNNGTALDIIGVTIFGSSLILLYTISTLYHSLINEKAKKIFQILDHCSIYILIAGTFTPIVFSVLRNTSPIAWVVFGFIWLAAILGIALYTLFPGKFKVLNLVSYTLMGWSALFLMPSLTRELNKLGSESSILWLILGGVCYTVGIIFYANKKIKYFHSIWHIFVLAGSVCHFFAVLLYILN